MTDRYGSANAAATDYRSAVLDGLLLAGMNFQIRHSDSLRRADHNGG